MTNLLITLQRQILKTLRISAKLSKLAFRPNVIVFLMFQIDIVSETKDKMTLEFDLKNVEAPIANTLRRVLIAEVTYVDKWCYF